ncbi:MAG: ATP-dependent helicase UvrD/PcrA, partial [Solirubrobacteraceae bacterium]|nr:ATP-dependent helicase UvrD/PcrA [Solirubrobacteraceae bacterium]
RGRVPMHRISLAGRDDQTRAALDVLGLSTRPAKGGGWRFETSHKDARAVLDLVDKISANIDVTVRCVGRLGSDPSRNLPGFSLPFTTASSVRPGMVMFTGDGGWDVVESVEKVTLDRPVYDLNVEGTHNFVANGIVTHNSIYGFRGADITNILEFEEAFPDARTIKLEQNYRSTQMVLDAANAVIAHNRGQKPKSLWTELGEGDPVKVRELDDEHAEARFVVGEVERLVDQGVSLSEIACFYRTNAQSRVLEDTLVRREIPYQIIGGTKFYERAVVKDVLAYLMVLANPQDVISFQRCANAPKRGLGQTSLSRVLAHAQTMGVSIWDAAADPASVPGLGTAAIRALGRFMATMEGLREQVAQSVPIGDLLEALLHESGYLDALQAERTFEAEGNIELLEQVVEVGREFDARQDPEADTLDQFLQQIALVADADTRRDDEGMATLMTLHNAKGLEYPIVFIIGMEEGVFPHSRALDEGGLEEERRLFYVGITRAMRDLYLTHARRRNVFGAVAPGLPSRFLAELPSEVTDADSKPAARGGILGRVTSWAGAAAGSASAAPTAPATAVPSFRLGEDGGHPAFGEGVVTSVEPGGIVVVRFAKDGSERKLMAEYAPLTHR